MTANLEDAIGDFAGKAGRRGRTKLPKTPPKPREKADCVILGYQSIAKAGSIRWCSARPIAAELDLCRPRVRPKCPKRSELRC